MSEMIVTEAEAREKLCILLKLIRHNTERCFGSRCMHWRWSPSLTIVNPERVQGVGQTVKKNHGYCGLSGMP